MRSPSTTSLILFENRRVTRSITTLAAQGCAAAVIVRRPLAERTASVNLEAPLPVARKSSVARPSAAEPPFPYKAGFGFTLSGSLRTPEERERLRKERLAFFRRGRAYRGRKELPTVKVWAASAPSGEQYEREFVGPGSRTKLLSHRPESCAPCTSGRPITGVRSFLRTCSILVPAVCELAPHDWDEWRPTRRPEHSRVVNTVHACSSPRRVRPANCLRMNLRRYFPCEWYAARAAQIRELRICMKRGVQACMATDQACRLVRRRRCIQAEGAFSRWPSRLAECASTVSIARALPTLMARAGGRTSGLTEGEVHSGRGCASSSVGLVFWRARRAFSTFEGISARGNGSSLKAIGAPSATSSAIFTSSLCFCAGEMRRHVGFAGEVVHVGRACALTSAVSAPTWILVAPKAGFLLTRATTKYEFAGAVGFTSTRVHSGRGAVLWRSRQNGLKHLEAYTIL
ncbi:hypothetical protein BJY52DRAFT_1391158 [Lactarius psammicola]|nr:hypothetical protein BJY52DRAFT_1391158 [Lactarius psammicola]